MLTVDDFAQIRRAYRDGMSIRAIARHFRHGRRVIREALREGEPQGYQLSRPRPAPKLGPFQEMIDQILAADATAPGKQRHTAKQIHRRLVAEGYTGGYDQVRRYVGDRRREARQTFIPLAHEPGCRLEADFGHIYVDYPSGRQQVPVLLTTWSYSHAKFAMAMPTERTEAILTGMVEALAYFDAVPRELWWDNPKTVAPQIFKGRSREWHARYAALVSHYGMDPKACMPASGWEKPKVENSVYDLQRRWATPVPKVRDNDQLNAYLRGCCERDLERTCAGYSEPIGARLAADRAAADALPSHPFDPCVPTTAKVDKYQTVSFDRNRYSVPRSAAFRAVTVKGYIDRVRVVEGETVIAEHRRSYGRQEQILEPRHYLATLDRRPAALDHAPVYRDWHLPASFTHLRTSLEARLGPVSGARQFVRVLQLLAEHPVTRVERALEQLEGHPDAERIIDRTEQLARREGRAPEVDDSGSPAGRGEVPVPGLARFNELLPSAAKGDGVS